MDQEEILRHTILEAARLYRYQKIVIHPWSSYLMELMVHHQMMTIRLILWKFTRSHQGQNNRLRTRIKLCNRRLTCHRPPLNRLFHFRSILTFRFQESCVRRHVPLTRSSGLHPDDTGPEAKLRFPSVGMKIPPPTQIARSRLLRRFNQSLFLDLGHRSHLW